MRHALAAIGMAAAGLLALGGVALAKPAIKQGKTVVVGSGVVSETALAAARSHPAESLAIFTRSRVLYTRRVSEASLGLRLTLAKGRYAASRFPEAAMAPLKDGRIAVGFIEQWGDQTDVVGVFLQSNGFKFNSFVDMLDSNKASNIAVAALTGSITAAYAWQVVEPSGDTGIRTRAFGRSGHYQGERFALTPPSGTSFANPAVAAYGKLYALVYDRQGSGAGIILQGFDGQARRKGKAIRLDGPNGTVHEAPRVTSLADKGVLVLWQENTYDTSVSPKVLIDRTLRGRTVSTAGELGPLFAIDDPVTPNSIEEDVEVIDVDGRQVVGWTIRRSKDGGTDADIRGVVIEGSWMSHVRRLTQGSAGDQSLAALVATGTDQFFTFYTERSDEKPYTGRGTVGVFNRLED